MKILIAVLTCHKFNYDMKAVDDCMVLYRGPEMDFALPRPPAIRETWWNDVPADVTKKFFYGSPSPRRMQDDEVLLNCADGYAFLPYKTKALCTWALDNGFTHMFKADDDTFVYVNRLLQSDFDQYSWIGRYNGGQFVAGGPGYWLDAVAMQAVAHHPVNLKHEWAEDKHVAHALLKYGFTPHFDGRYVDLRRGEVESDTIAVCECRHSKMRELYLAEERQREDVHPESPDNRV